MAGKGRIGFRGDSRPPAIIFKEGFQPREPGAPLHYDEVKEHMNEKTAVCLSWRLSVAALFPLPELDLNAKGLVYDFQPETWIYVVHVNLTSVAQNKSLFFNTHGTQVLAADSQDEVDGLFKRLMFYADEVALKAIPPEAILFAVKCKREFRDLKCWFQGGSYHLDSDIIENPQASLKIPSELRLKAKAFLAEEIEAEDLGSGYEMPLSDSGFDYNPVKVNKPK